MLYHKTTAPCEKYVVCIINSPTSSSLPPLPIFLDQDLASMCPPQTWAQERGKCHGSPTHTPTQSRTLWVLRRTQPICTTWLVYGTNFKMGQIKSNEWVTWTVVSCLSLLSWPLSHFSSLKSSFTHWGLCVYVCVCVCVCLCYQLSIPPIKTCQTGLIWLKMENIYSRVCLSVCSYVYHSCYRFDMNRHKL